MLNIAIVDDDENYRTQIKGMLHDYEKEFGESFHITEYTDGDELVEKYKSDFDIILLDVEMQFMDGMSAAEEIRQVDPDVILVFITNMPQYAIRGYKVDALDYILKPISYYPFSQTIKRAIGRRHRTDKEYLVVGIKGGKQKIDIDEICYLEVINHDLYIHTISGVIEAKGTINGVIKSKLTDKKWTFYGELKDVVYDGIEPIPEPEPTPSWRPTIRRGDKGADVIECQTMLTRLGYDIGKTGIDGDFGRATEAGVKAFQSDHRLVVDGVVGPMTWDALDKAVAQINEKPSEKTYTVIIRGLDKAQADAIANNYPGAEIVKGE
jgi:DNA-binding LytR/AlgR family response regulator